MSDEHSMGRCLDLAERGRGCVGINPMVGALLVRGGVVIAEGWHRQFGGEHAERDLLNRIDDQKLCSESTLYVNMEPCCHDGKTPPCTDIIVQKGIRRVVYGMVDPDPRVAGKGIALLQSAGIEVVGPVLPSLCRRLNRGFVSLQLAGRPWITIKKAQTRDGRIANDDGSPMKITSPEQDRWSHQWLRAKHDAILVGVQTMITDDPHLTIRHGTNTKFDQKIPQPYRIILDPHLRISPQAKVLTDAYAQRTIVCAETKAAVSNRGEAILATGARVIPFCFGGDSFDWSELWKSLTKPGEGFDGLSSILVEGGVRTWETCEKAHIFDEEITLVGA